MRSPCESCEIGIRRGGECTSWRKCKRYIYWFGERWREVTAAIRSIAERRTK